MLAMLLNAVLLRSCFPILLHVDMFVALQGMDGLVGKFNPVDGSAVNVNVVSVFQTYVKPLIKVNSCLIVPPCFLAVSLALEYVQLWMRE